jgi:hypothetical protein
MPLNLRGTAAAILSLVTVSGAETAFGKSLAGFLYRLPGIPRCSRVIRQASHLWWYRRCQHTFSQRTGSGGAAAGWHGTRADVSASGF